MKKSTLVPISLVLILFSCKNNIKTVEWISTNPIAQWQTSQLTAINTAETNDSSIIIYPENKQQIIDGFGGCFNEMGWEAMSILSPEVKENIFKSLFDTITGCAFTICRMPIGANDYAVDWYSFDETKNDFALKDFSLERDRERLIPYIKKAKSYNKGLKIWASPWCPPSWMKTNDHYACSPAANNGLPESGKGKEMQTQFRMQENYLSSYALYFSKFIQEYKDEGIDIYAVHVQNEMNSCQGFPSCIWTPSDLATFIGKYLGPQFAKSMINTDIWLGTIERPQIERVDTILTDPEAMKYVKGVGFQWAGKDAITEVHKKYPAYKLMQTETECGNGSNDWKAAEHTFGLMKHYFNNGANAYMYWNMVLNETGKSQWGWKQNSMISINSESKEVNYNPEFYLMKHFSHFIKPGSHKIETSDENCLAFRNANSIIVIWCNFGNKTEKDFEVDGYRFKVMLAEGSLNTFKIII